MEIKDFIPYGKEHAITREKLRKLTGYNDREIRAMIEKEIRAGNAILSSSGAAGYWQTDDINEIERFLKERDRRRNTEARNLIELRLKVAKANGYLYIPVKAHMRRINRKETGVSND